MNRLDIAIEQIRRTRQYTKMVLDHTDRHRWFDVVATTDGAAVSHVAWQVGHITWAQAGHVLRVVCGHGDDLPLPPRWGECFGKGVEPTADPTRYPTVDELEAAMDAVYDASMAALPAVLDAALDEPVTHPTGMIPDKFAMLLYNARHEMLHVGQIGLIRRLLGDRPYR